MASVDNVSQVYYTLFVDGSEYFGGEVGVRERTVLDLSPSTTYSFKITASDAYGNSVDSNLLSVTTPGATDTECTSTASSITSHSGGATQSRIAVGRGRT
jgi:hypothetical protein